jgi:hypothetical protein
MTILPTNRFVKCSFYTPIGATNVRLHGIEIVGDWKQKASDYYGERGLTLAQRFAVLPWYAESIRKFTQQWGPLYGNPYDGRDGFRFSFESWRQNQLEFTKLWRSVRRTGAAPWETQERIWVDFRPKAVTLRCPDLFTFMVFELLSNAKALRVCKWPRCQHPNFLAQHGKEQYCSTECANEAQSEWKRRWHEKQREKRMKEES